MNKRMRELQGLILEKSKAAKSLTEGDNVTKENIKKASEILDEVDELQKEFETLERVEKAQKAGVPEDGSGNGASPKKDSTKEFADAVRAHFKNLNETTGADGGYTVPEDISTRINALREEHFSLSSLIDHEAVSTLSGRRTYKKRAQHTGFQKVGEKGKITKTGKPQFSVLEYTIQKFAGYMPVTNELLEDSDAAIVDVMTEWLALDSVATENAQILAKIKEKGETTITGIKDIKKAINVTLAAFAGSCRIVTNSDGLQYLDTLEDGNGRPLLSPDPARPMGMYLSVGARSIPLDVVPNDVLPTDTQKIPFIMGDLFEYLKQFDRKGMMLTTSNTAAVTDFNAFEEDMTLIRAIMRADWQVKDDQAIVRGALTPAVE